MANVRKQHIFVVTSLIFIISFSSITGEIKKNHPGIGNNFRIYPSNITQTETFITTHPTNPNILFAAANTINLNTGFISEGVYVSTNGGFNWYGSDTCKGSPINFHRGDPGIAIDKDGNFILIRLGFIPGLYSHFSKDNGLTWSSQKTIATEDQDRASLVSDGIATSSFYGRTYAGWVKYAPPYPVLFSYTDDGASTWSPVSQINSPIQRCQGVDMTIGPNGEVYVCWAGVKPTSPYTEDFVGFAASSNGGATWQVQENAFDMNGIAGILTEKSNIRVNGLPSIDVDKSGGIRNGWIYIVTTQKNLSPAGTDPDIILNYSTDGGITWSAGIRVNQDPLNNGKIQYFPAINIDNSGGINIIYYDDRNTTSDSASVYLSRSIDGGNSWTDYKISDHNFKPSPIGGLGQGYQGDNIGLTSVGKMIWPVWMSNSTGIYQIWTCPIDLTKLNNTDDENEITQRFYLGQNYPNPFNQSTILNYVIHEEAFVRIKLFDILGREIKSLVEKQHYSGAYQLEINSEDLSSGVYICRMNVQSILGNRQLEKVIKILLLR